MLPNLIIIGAMKCGTTSLHEYLSYHPDVFMSKRKELNFFVSHQNWSKGLAWYESHFTEVRKVVGESSPNYTRHPLFPGVPERMHALLPDAKLIYCVRDPVQRFISHYLHTYSLGRENRTLDRVLATLHATPYLLCSQYHYQLAQYLKYYPASQIKVVVLEELQHQPQETMQDVYTFLGVNPTYQDPRVREPSATMPSVAQRRRSPLKNLMVKRKIPGVYWTERHLPWIFGPPLQVPELCEEQREVLVDALAEDTAHLERFIGRQLPFWSTSRREGSHATAA